jgi:hypothetical protein
LERLKQIWIGDYVERKINCHSGPTLGGIINMLVGLSIQLLHLWNLDSMAVLQSFQIIKLHIEQFQRVGINQTWVDGHGQDTKAKGIADYV